MIARVRGVMAASICAGSIRYVSGLDVHEDGQRTHQQRRIGRGNKGVRRRDHFVARPDIQRPQGDLERGRAVDHGYGMAGLLKLCKLTFKGLDLGARQGAPIARAHNLQHSRLFPLVEDGPGWERRMPNGDASFNCQLIAHILIRLG